MIYSTLLPSEIISLFTLCSSTWHRTRAFDRTEALPQSPAAQLSSLAIHDISYSPKIYANNESWPVSMNQPWQPKVSTRVCLLASVNICQLQHPTDTLVFDSSAQIPQTESRNRQNKLKPVAANPRARK